MILGKAKTNSLREMLLEELDDATLVDKIFLTIKLYHPPLADEVQVRWESDWTNMNQINPWFAKVDNNGTNIKRIYMDCKSDYKSSNKKLVQKKLEANVKIGTIVEYVSGGNSKRALQYYGIITKHGLYQLGEIEDNTTILNFLSRYCDDLFEQITEEHSLLVDYNV